MRRPCLLGVSLIVAMSTAATADDTRDCLEQRDEVVRIKSCSAVIQHDPHHVVAYHNRGLAYAAKDELDRAVADYTKAIELNPNYGPAFEDRGRVYARKGDYTRAIADVTRASELAPKGMSQEKALAQTSRKTQPPPKSPPTAKSLTLQTSEAGTVLPGTTLIETVPGGSYPGWALHGLGRY